jgi:hypothetical protein
MRLIGFMVLVELFIQVLNIGSRRTNIWYHAADIKPDNILIEIPDVNEAVQSHLTKLKESNISQPEDSSLMSRSIVNDTIPDSSKFNIRITDFGVGMCSDNSLPFLQNTELIHCVQPPGKTTTWPSGFSHRPFVLLRFFLVLHGAVVLTCGGSPALYVS